MTPAYRIETLIDESQIRDRVVTLAAEINDDFQQSLRELGAFRKIAEVGFSNQRNRVLGL